MTDRNIFDKTLEIIGENGEHWITSFLRKKRGDEDCYCLIGALYKASTGEEPPAAGDEYEDSTYVYEAVDGLDLRPLLTEIPDAIVDGDGRDPSDILWIFNDTRGFQSVRSALRIASGKVNA